MSEDLSLANNLEAIRAKMAAACARAGRDPASVSLMAVSKGHPASAVAALSQLGQTLFGESKVQEAKAKIPSCPGNTRWQMIGHLQTNKAKDAVRLFSMIQSVDSLRLAEEIHSAAEKASKTMPILLEVNVAGESSKFGYSPDQVLADFLAINDLKRLEIHGLMTIAPWTPSPEKTRAVFRRLADLKHRCEELLGAPLPVLSMGMSNDFEIAIEEGATLVRVGTALFGERKYSKPAGDGDEV